MVIMNNENKNAESKMKLLNLARKLINENSIPWNALSQKEFELFKTSWMCHKVLYYGTDIKHRTNCLENKKEYYSYEICERFLKIVKSVLEDNNLKKCNCLICLSKFEQCNCEISKIDTKNENVFIQGLNTKGSTKFENYDYCKTHKSKINKID